MASSAWRASTRPPGVSARTPAPSRASAVTGVPSQIRAPAASAARASPQHSRTGSTSARRRRASTARRGTSASSTCARIAAAVEQLGLPAVRAQQLGLLLEPRQLVLGGRDRDLARAPRQPQSIPWRSIAARIPARFSRPIRSSCASSSGQRARPLPIPWVSEAEQKPPLRPDAPNASRSPSSRTTRLPSSAACSAPHRPVRPPPTTTRSASSRPSSGGRAVRPGLVEPERRHVSCSDSRADADEDERASRRRSRTGAGRGRRRSWRRRARRSPAAPIV